jgi:hypothetical protein
MKPPVARPVTRPVTRPYGRPAAADAAAAASPRASVQALALGRRVLEIESAAVAALADRLDELADACGKYDSRSERASDIRAAATIWRKHLAGPVPCAAVGADDFAAHTVLSGTARRKVADLIASGYRICGYTMERPGHRSAVVFDAAVRWLDEDQRHALMFVEGSRVVGRPRSTPDSTTAKCCSSFSTASPCSRTRSPAGPSTLRISSRAAPRVSAARLPPPPRPTA